MPSGSVAQVTPAQCSNQPGGINPARLASGTPVIQRSRACACVTVR